MPGGDRTGPLGQGPGSGRAFGYCYGYDSPGFTKWPGAGMGRGFGFGRGSVRGMGRGRWFGRVPFMTSYSPAYFGGYAWPRSLSREDEMKMLREQAEELKRSQKEIEKRLSELEKES